MYFCDIDKRPQKEILTGIRIQSFWEEKMLLVVVELDAGAVVPPHNHEHEQAGTMLSGEMALTIAGETRTIRPGDCYIIPGNVEHSVVVGSEVTRLVEVFAPVRETYKY